MLISSMNLPWVKQKISVKQQADCLMTISKLLKNGFSLNQAIRCLQYVHDSDPIYQQIYQDLSSGYTLSASLCCLELPSVVQNQLFIAQVSGDLQVTIERCGILLMEKAKQINKLVELLTYPMFIFSFLILMMLGMKLYILPELQTGSNSPLDMLLGSGMLLLVCLIMVSVGFYVWLKRRDEYQRAQILVHLPIVGTTYLCFYQFTILQGWSMQFSSGLDLQKICLNNQNFVDGSIQNIIAKKILYCLKNGNQLQRMIDKEPLLPNELNILLFLGGASKEVAQDLKVLSELKFVDTQKSIKKLLKVIQPILFFIIAIFILIAYLMILLPVYGMMKGMS